MTRSVMQHKTAFDEFLIGFKVEQKAVTDLSSFFVQGCGPNAVGLNGLDRPFV